MSELSGGAVPGSEGYRACEDEVEEARAELYREQARKLREETAQPEEARAERLSARDKN